ncbi:MAG: 4-alpha-glucanotransferase [Tissierellia bacterium]|nr:4-alpha-glucanotransferase [Tissierellia bacterium]
MKIEYDRLDESFFKRCSGILLHISSLPSPYGIGTLGEKAYDFVDFLELSGQRLWQILPINPTGFGDSPYQSFSLYAGNPYLIDLEKLIELGLLDRSFVESFDLGNDIENVDYYLMYKNKLSILKTAYEKNIAKKIVDIDRFLMLNSHWAIDYAEFMALKNKLNGAARSSWPIEYKRREKNQMDYFRKCYEFEINFHIFMQAVFYEQYFKLKEYANSKGIKIVGDIPIYAADDSCDIWISPKYFQLDEDLNKKFVGGCPPDAFSKTGQLWGNPTYDWKNLEADNFDWWIRRLRHSGFLYDIIRIDHFRGFESFWQVANSEETAENGEWIKAPGYELFEKIENELPHLEIIAEDLGFMTKEVIDFRKHTGYPGMKVLQFAWDRNSESDILPHNIDYNWTVYTGTHDNDTTLGFFESAPKSVRDYAIDYLKLTKDEGYTWGFIRACWATNAKYAIAPMQDFLVLDSSARMNEPSTLGNWTWRAKEEAFTDKLAKKIKDMTILYSRY